LSLSIEPNNGYVCRPNFVVVVIVLCVSGSLAGIAELYYIRIGDSLGLPAVN